MRLPDVLARAGDALLAVGAATRLTRFVVVEDLALWTIRDPARRWAARSDQERLPPRWEEYRRLVAERQRLIDEGADPDTLAQPARPGLGYMPDPVRVEGWRTKLISGLECGYCAGTWIHLGWQALNMVLPRTGPLRTGFRVLAAALTASYVAGHIGSALGDVNDDDIVDAEIGEEMMRTAIVYRTQARALKPDIEQHNYGQPDQPQFELAVFSDGRVAQRWLIGAGSCVWWDRIEDLYSVHIYAHPDYGTRVEWSDGEVEEL